VLPDDVLTWFHRPDLAIPDSLLATETGGATRQGRDIAVRMYESGDWRSLADHYDQLAEVAWRSSEFATALRLLVAARAAALRAGDRTRADETTYYLAHRHRLRAGALPAQRWNRELLTTDLDATTVLNHVRALRELAAIHEVSGTYEAGMRLCRAAEEICATYSDEPGIANQYVRVLLQRATIERLRGGLNEALRTVRQAREHARAAGSDQMTVGLVALREGALHLVLGNTQAALAAYREAETMFTGLSDNNAMTVRIRQIRCLSELGRYDEALRLAQSLRRDCAERRDLYRVGQITLEHAEVLQAMGEHEMVSGLLATAEPLFRDSRSLEALRWHRHRARSLITTGVDGETAARHLLFVLDVAVDPDRRDLTRIAFVLNDLLRLPTVPELDAETRLAASRAALAAVESQRDSLSESEARWSLHAIREEVYASSILLHHDAGRHDDTAAIIELGRADVLNQLLTAGGIDEFTANLPIMPNAGALATDAVLDAANAIRARLRGLPGHRPPLVPLPDSMPEPSDLDRFGDVVVLNQIGGTAATGWWSCTAVRERGGDWRTMLRHATGPLPDLVSRLAAGELLPAHGVTKAVWSALGDFLLPNDAIWAGTRDRPRAVTLCPDPRLWQVPYPALRRDDAALVDVAELTVAPSLRTQALLLDRCHGRLYTAEPVLSLLDDGLPGQPTEKSALDNWPGGHRPIADLTAVSPNAALLYVTGRGDRPGLSSLGPAGMNLQDLAAAQLPPVLLLNGCWSGTAESRYGQDPLSLAVGGLLGGADTVLAGVGLIGGMAAAYIGSDVLVHLAAGESPRAALRRAQLSLRESCPELGPSDWAGMCLVGVNPHQR
jgi:tetratricopeptide (TPR) repeat protein